MQLVVDVGNTETVVGLASSTTELVADWRVSSSVPRTADEMTALIRAFLAGSDVDESTIVRGVVGSVVPSVNYVWSKTIKAITGADSISVGPESELPIRLDVEEPLSVGADRIVNTLAARELYHRDTIAVDLGTATTFDCITADGVFKGGVISPGLRAGLDWLPERGLLPGDRGGGRYRPAHPRRVGTSGRPGGGHRRVRQRTGRPSEDRRHRRALPDAVRSRHGRGTHRR